MPPLLGCVAASGTRERGLVGGMAADRVGPNRPRRLAYFYSKLAHATLNARPVLRMWKLMPKLHMFEHMCEDQVPYWGLNPRFYTTYMDEDLVGQFIEIASSCHPATCATSALFKWLHLSFDST